MSISSGCPTAPFLVSITIRFPGRTSPLCSGEFDAARFFSTPRLDPRYGGEDSLVKRLGYRDEWKIHEVVDAGRPLPAISNLEQRFRSVTQLDRYLTPSVSLYRELIQVRDGTSIRWARITRMPCYRRRLPATRHLSLCFWSMELRSARGLSTLPSD